MDMEHEEEDVASMIGSVCKTEKTRANVSADRRPAWLWLVESAISTQKSQADNRRPLKWL